jgi:hypothetical protein
MPSKSGLQKVSNQATNTATNATNQQNQFANQAGAGYADFATTGGITPEQQQLTREQTASGIGSLYSSLKQNLQQRQRTQGGYSPGYGANERSLGRDTAAATGGAVNNANLGLLQQIQQGKLAGLGGQTSLANLYGGQVPALLGIGERSQAAKPGFLQEAGAVEGLASPIFGGISGATGGGGFGGFAGGF